MRLLIQTSIVLTLVGLGYALGTGRVFAPAELRAQAGAPAPAPETVDQINSANEALMNTLQALQREGLYRPAINGLNAFAATVGGVDAIGDLEAGRGVDPETFAGLYAGQATQTVAAELGKDDKGRLTYKGKVIRMYSVGRLKELFARRAELAGRKKPTLGTKR